MPRKASGTFDQKQYIKSWKKEHMKSIKFTYRTDFIDKFRSACSKLGVVQSQVIKEAMQQIIDKASQN